VITIIDTPSIEIIDGSFLLFLGSPQMNDLFEAIRRDECDRLTRPIEASSLEQTNNDGYTPLRAACLSLALANYLFDNWNNATNNIIDRFLMRLNDNFFTKMFAQILLDNFNCIVERARLGNRQFTVEAVCRP
jgi:hypothetical protein